MERSIQKWAESLFDSIKHVDEEGNEYWLARELAMALEYTWEGFQPLINRAKVAVTKTGGVVDNHFRDVSKMVTLGGSAERDVGDVELTRFACYIIAQNGNPAKKPKIAGAQSYFAIQTRKQELRQEQDHDVERLIARQKYTESDKHISEAIMEKGMSGRGLGIIKNSGDRKLYGGKTTKQMKQKYGITNPRTPLANRAPNVVLAAKSLANEMTATNLAQYPIDTFREIKGENDDNNSEIRKALGERGIVPEDVPAEEDTDKIMKRFSAKSKRQELNE